MGYYYKSSLPYYSSTSSRYSNAKCFYPKVFAFMCVFTIIFLVLYILKIIPFLNKKQNEGPSSDYYENIISDLRNEINELNEQSSSQNNANEVTDSSLNNRIAELEELLVVEEEGFII
tara:strand:- start:2681 stop:3034 length:354 start_codon:yes stop_codon:yes gene_type:complete